MTAVALSMTVPATAPTPRVILGIDPGLSGALALFTPTTGALTVFDVPTFTLGRNGKSKREVDTVELARLIDAAGPIAHAFVEQVGAMPGQGVSSVFAFGKVYGLLLGVLAANFIPHSLVPPQRWKRALSVPAEKDGARARASQLMPAHAGLWCRVKDDGRAEAALIAYYGATQEAGL
jgi:crossover junction endodeoxyribonuclease RuvC